MFPFLKMKQRLSKNMKNSLSFCPFFMSVPLGGEFCVLLPPPCSQTLRLFDCSCWEYTAVRPSYQMLPVIVAPPFRDAAARVEACMLK